MVDTTQHTYPGRLDIGVTKLLRVVHDKLVAIRLDVTCKILVQLCIDFGRGTVEAPTTQSDKIVVATRLDSRVIPEDLLRAEFAK